MNVRLGLTLTAAAIVLLVSGCGGSDTPASEGTTPAARASSTTVAASPTSSAPTAAPTTPPSAATSPTAAQTTASSTAAPSGTPAVSMDLSNKSLTGIVSPSGHIACLLTDDPVAARCDVEGAHWAGVKLPKCPLDYGDSAEVGPKKAHLTCHGDTVFGVPGAVTLPYGQSARYHDIVCTSRTTGITCWNGSGHGFMVSRESYRLY